MNKSVFLLSALLFYAGCASGPETVSRPGIGLRGEQRIEGQRAREAGLSDEWVLKAVTPATEAAPAEVISEEPKAAGTSGRVGTSGSGGAVELTDQAEIELRKEELVVGKREVSNGSVIVRKIVQTEDVSQPIELMREEYVIERIPASQAQQAAGPGIQSAFQMREIYLPLMREEPVASKRTLLTETVSFGKQIETDHQTITAPVRSESLEIVKNPDLSQARFSHLPHRALPIAAQESTVTAATALPGDSADTIKLTKEELMVGKRAVENGAVYLQKIVRTEDASVPVELSREEFRIDRRPAGNQIVSGAEFSPREIRVNLGREQAVVGTRNFVTEMVRIRKQTLTDKQIVSGAVRRESLEIVKNAAPPTPTQVGAAAAFQSGAGSGSGPSRATTGGQELPSDK